MKSVDNLRPIPVRRLRYVFGALCLPLFGIVLAACGPDRPATTTTTATDSPTPSPTVDRETAARNPRATSETSKVVYESLLANANKALKTEANVKKLHSPRRRI